MQAGNLFKYKFPALHFAILFAIFCAPLTDSSPVQPTRYNIRPSQPS